MSEERARRIAENEATFRNVNEQIRRIGGSSRSPVSTYLCECGNPACEEKVSLSPAAYETIRGHPHRFFVKRGHVFPDVESVVEVQPEYEVVEKVTPEGRRVVEETDPRS